ncbi:MULTISPECIES: MerR family transcriptional regulator [unclassified Streptomyces]|uniref:MerR family transcriptional regulator n=1 Tax=unclassified Streptomyces TaxID=2593676 RepID=UPI002884364D|nr:MerR family transcriptional regulator [Streptomyces sp. DSM 41633]
MRIGDAAAAAGTTARALRLYEERGLLPPVARTPSGQRRYADTDVALVRMIRELLSLGLTIEDLRTRADRLPLLTRDPAPACGSVDEDGSGGSGLAPVVDRRIAALDAEIARLTRRRDELARRARPAP